MTLWKPLQPSICRTFVDIGCRSFKYNFASQSSGIRPHIYQVVRLPQNILVVLYDNHRVTQFNKIFQHPNQPMGVSAMQSDAGFVKNIQRTDERTAQRGCQLNTLTLSAAQCIRLPIQRKIVQPHVYQELQSVVNLCQYPRGDKGILFTQF